MVSPHPKWSDIDDGYANESDTIRILVHPARTSYGPGGDPFSITVVAPEQANSYSVDLMTGPGTVNADWEPIVQFSEARDAWEFANLLTHFIIEINHPRESLDRYLPFRDSSYPGEVWEPTEIIEELSPGTVLKKLYHPMPFPEDTAELIEE